MSDNNRVALQTRTAKERMFDLISDEVKRAAEVGSYRPERVEAIVELLFDDWLDFLAPHIMAAGKDYDSKPKLEI